jgi:hypothetical protein
MSTHRDSGEHGPLIVAGVGSAVLSALALLPRPLVNNDGIVYLVAAEAFARDGFDAARAIHGWPFYSILIAGVAGVLRVSMETAAHLTGAGLLAAACIAFVAVARGLGGDRRIQWLAAAVVLAHPWLNRSRALVVRDFGVWAFGLLALAMLLRLDRAGRARAAIRWAACGVAAVLFRADAVALMAAAPIALALHRDLPRRERVAATLALLVPTLLATAGAAAWILTDPLYAMSAAPFRDAAAALARSFPLPYGREYAPFILGLGLAAVPVAKTIKTAGLIHAGLAALGMARGGPAHRFHRVALWATLAAAAVPLYVHVLRLLFVESRYTVFATLVLCAWAPFGLAWLTRAGAPLSRVAAAALGVMLALTLVVSVPVRPASEGHVREAAAWIRQNAGASRLHTNSLQLAYYSGARVNWHEVLNSAFNGPWFGAPMGQDDVWAVRVAPGQDEVRKRLDQVRLLQRRASFVGPDGDAVLVYSCSAVSCVSGS